MTALKQTFQGKEHITALLNQINPCILFSIEKFFFALSLTVKRFDFSELNVSESGTVTSICWDIFFLGTTTTNFKFSSVRFRVSDLSEDAPHSTLFKVSTQKRYCNVTNYFEAFPIMSSS